MSSTQTRSGVDVGEHVAHIPTPGDLDHVLVASVNVFSTWSRTHFASAATGDCIIAKAPGHRVETARTAVSNFAVATAHRGEIGTHARAVSVDPGPQVSEVRLLERGDVAEVGQVPVEARAWLPPH